MEEKVQEEDDENDDDIVDINAVQVFGMPNEAFLGKDAENKKNKEEEEEKRKVDNYDGGKKSGSGMKRGRKMRGGIDRSSPKGDNKDDADSVIETKWRRRNRRRKIKTKMM